MNTVLFSTGKSIVHAMTGPSRGWTGFPVRRDREMEQSGMEKSTAAGTSPSYNMA